jgi:hypothetical protein
MRFAVVNPLGGTVENVVTGTDLTEVQSVVGPCVLETEQTGRAQVGAVWDGQTFTIPDE